MPETKNYSTILSELKQKESELLVQLTGVRAAIAGISKARTVTEPSNWISRPGSDTTYRNLGIKRASIEVLRLRGRPLGSTEIANALIAGGYRSTSRKFYRTVYNVLKADLKKEASEIVKTEEGWALREWTEVKRPPAERKKSRKVSLED
jgi:hypothetical protein